MFTSNSATNSIRGGAAFEGAIYIASTGSSNTMIYSTSFTNNNAEGNTGTSALTGGTCGPGGVAAGGAIENLSGSLTITNSSFTGNRAQGGNGGNASQFGIGGTGGTATGGAIDYQGGPSLVVSHGVTFMDNKAVGGNGGRGGSVPQPLLSDNGGTGGNAYGGAVEVDSGFDGIDATFTSNRAQGGKGMMSQTQWKVALATPAEIEVNRPWLDPQATGLGTARPGPP